MINFFSKSWTFPKFDDNYFEVTDVNLWHLDRVVTL